MLTRFLSRSNFRVSRSAFEKERGERDLRRSQKSRAESPPGRIHFGGGIPLILQAKRPSTGVVSRRGDIEAASYLPLSLSLSRPLFHRPLRFLQTRKFTRERPSIFNVRCEKTMDVSNGGQSPGPSVVDLLVTTASASASKCRCL